MQSSVSAGVSRDGLPHLIEGPQDPPSPGRCRAAQLSGRRSSLPAADHVRAGCDRLARPKIQPDMVSGVAQREGCRYDRHQEASNRMILGRGMGMTSMFRGCRHQGGLA
jgi:hypothetical protein